MPDVMYSQHTPTQCSLNVGHCRKKRMVCGWPPRAVRQAFLACHCYANLSLSLLSLPKRSAFGKVTCVEKHLLLPQMTASLYLGRHLYAATVRHPQKGAEPCMARRFFL